MFFLTSTFKARDVGIFQENEAGFAVVYVCCSVPSVGLLLRNIHDACFTANRPHITLFRLQALAQTLAGCDRMNQSKFRRDKRGMISVEAALVLISFVIVAVALALLVVDVGLFATQQGKQTIQQGVSGSSTPLLVDGDTLIRGDNADASNIDAMMIPLETLGVRYVPMSQNLTEIGLQVGNRTAYADIYMGINNTLNPQNTQLDTLVSRVGNSTGAMLFVGNSNRDNALDSNEKGYLILHFAAPDEPIENEPVHIEIKTDIGIPLSIDFVIPSQTTQGWQTLGG